MSCSYVCELWRAIGGLFSFPVPRGNGSLLSMFEACCAVSCSSQVRPLWMTVVVSVLWIVWRVRNSLIFEDVVTPSFVALRFVVKAVKEVAVFNLGYCVNAQADLFTL